MLLAPIPPPTPPPTHKHTPSKFGRQINLIQAFPAHRCCYKLPHSPFSRLTEVFIKILQPGHIFRDLITTALNASFQI
jgi:hypothetical protein